MDALEDIIRLLKAGSITDAEAKRRMAALEGRKERKHHAKARAHLLRYKEDVTGSAGDDDSGDAEIGVVVGNYHADPVRVLMAAEQRAELRRRLSALPDRWRKLVLAHYFDGVPQVDLATDRGVSESAISQQLEKARRTLREGLNFSDFRELLNEGRQEIRPPRAVVIPGGLTPAEWWSKSFVRYKVKTGPKIPQFANRLDAYLAACFDVSVESARSMIAVPGPYHHTPRPAQPRSVEWALREWAKRTRRELQQTAELKPWWSRNEDGEIVIVNSHITDQEVFASLANPARVQAQRQDTPKPWPHKILGLDKEHPLAKALNEEAKALRRAGKQHNSHLGLPSPLLMRQTDRVRWGAIRLAPGSHRWWLRWDELDGDWWSIIEEIMTEATPLFRVKIEPGGLDFCIEDLEDLSDRLVGRPPVRSCTPTCIGGQDRRA